MKKKIIIAIILIILVIIGGVGYLIIKDFQQEDKLKAELDEITKIANFEDRNIDEIEKCKTTYYELLTEEKAMSYINGKGLDDYYIDFYKQEIVGNIEEEQKDRTVEKSINEVIELLNNSKNVIDFLSENKGKWQIEGENIVFNNNTLSNKYKELLDKVV